MSLPKSWADIYDRLSYTFGSRADAEEWVRQTLELTWGVLDPCDLERGRRQIAFQWCSGVVLSLEEQDPHATLLLDPSIRAVVGRTFARFFKGAVPDGPPWRLSPFEDLPSYEEWRSAADF